MYSQWGSSLCFLQVFSTSWLFSTKNFKNLVYLLQCFGSLSIWKRWSARKTSSMNGRKPSCKISQYHVAVKIPLKITIGVAPRADIPAQMCSYNGCFGRGFNLRFSCFLLKQRRPWLSNCTEHSSVQITFKNLSPFEICSWHHTTRFSLLASWTSWLYFGCVATQPRLLRALLSAQRYL